MDRLVCTCPYTCKITRRVYFAVIGISLLGIAILWNNGKLLKTVPKSTDKSGADLNNTHSAKPTDKVREDLDNPYSTLLLGTEMINDIATVASNVRSSVRLLENRTYAVAERAEVLITLRDQLGKLKTSGGDILRVWLRDTSLKANVAGEVRDNGNGTYTGSVLLPWKGRPKIYVSIALPRELNTLILQEMAKNAGSYYIVSGKFRKTSNGPSEVTQCGPQPMTQPTKMCNFTHQNFDLPWYCKAPTTHDLTCKDWKMVLGDKNVYPSENISELIRKYQHRKLKQSLELQVEGGNDLIPLNDTPCHMWPKGDSWNARPSGFYYKGKWHNLKCKLTQRLPILRYKRCFANRQLLLIGDSNVRAIGRSISNSMKIKFLKGNPQSSMPQDIMAYEKENNITINMFPHQLPYYVYIFVDKNLFVSVAKRLDDIPAGDNRIILIHLWLHLLRVHVHAFRHHVRQIRQAMERLLLRSPKVHISIKGPHAFTYRDQFLPVDYMALQHMRIWWEEFVGLHNKIVFLNEWDRTVGNENVNGHPDCVTDLIYNFLGHVCDP